MGKKGDTSRESFVGQSPGLQIKKKKKKLVRPAHFGTALVTQALSAPSKYSQPLQKAILDMQVEPHHKIHCSYKTNSVDQPSSTIRFDFVDQRTTTCNLHQIIETHISIIKTYILYYSICLAGFNAFSPISPMCNLPMVPECMQNIDPGDTCTGWSCCNRTRY